MAFVKLADNYTDLIGKFAVALLAEGVDRNYGVLSYADRMTRSPSSRRAWIEIILVQNKISVWRVALLAEGVDRNTSSS